MLRAAQCIGERGDVHPFFELLRVFHILSGLWEQCVLCCGGSRNEAVAVDKTEKATAIVLNFFRFFSRLSYENRLSHRIAQRGHVPAVR